MVDSDGGFSLHVQYILTSPVQVALFQSNSDEQLQVRFQSTNSSPSRKSLVPSLMNNVCGRQSMCYCAERSHQYDPEKQSCFRHNYVGNRGRRTGPPAEGDFGVWRTTKESSAVLEGLPNAPCDPRPTHTHMSFQIRIPV